MVKNNLCKYDYENEDQYIWRIGQMVDKKIFSWNDIKDTISEQLGLSEEEYRTESAYRKKYQNFRKAFENIFSKSMVSKDSISNHINQQINELQEERYKIQTEKIELNRWKRENARDNLIFEKIENAIHNLKPLELSNIDIYPTFLEQNETNDNNKGYILCFADCHYGKDLKIKGLYNETINEYSPEKCEERLWELFNQTLKIIYKENIKVLHIYDFGDEIDGLLRVSQLMKLRYGVIDSVINFSEILANWLNELSKYVKIEFQMVLDSNHCQLRQLGQPKNTFKDDNLSKVIFTFLKIRLKDNNRIIIHENPTGYIYDDICGYKILGIHGEIKDMSKGIREFSSMYNVNLNYLIGGHIHHSKGEEVGFDTEVINIPSIIGIDDYSVSLRKCSNAGAKLLCFEKNRGKTIEYNIKL